MQPATLEAEPPVARINNPTDPLDSRRDPVRLEALGLMTAGIVHDLGNVIQILSTSVEILDEHPAIRTTRALQPVMGRAVRSLERAGGLVNEILDFTRPDVSAQAALNVAMCLDGFDRLLRWIGGRGTKINIRVTPDLPLIVCNRSRLENAILNLVLNARDAMPDGGSVSIEASLSDDGRWISLSVSDTGSGMMPETMARAFEPFFTTKKDKRGTGLGLAMVRRFAEEAHGTVVIKSKLGHGTTVILQLPLQTHE